MKIILVFLALALVTGCNTTNPAYTYVTNQNEPDSYERKDYFELCIGQSIHSSNPVPDDLRIACVAAVLGNY
jgi:hypothetical protein